MHNTIIKEKAEYLEQFKVSLIPGGVQEKVRSVYKYKDFDPEQHGTYHITPLEKLENHKTVYIETVIGV